MYDNNKLQTAQEMYSNTNNPVNNFVTRNEYLMLVDEIQQVKQKNQSLEFRIKQLELINTQNPTNNNNNTNNPNLINRNDIGMNLNPQQLLTPQQFYANTNNNNNTNNFNNNVQP